MACHATRQVVSSLPSRLSEAGRPSWATPSRGPLSLHRTPCVRESGGDCQRVPRTQAGEHVHHCLPRSVGRSQACGHTERPGRLGNVVQRSRQEGEGTGSGHCHTCPSRADGFPALPSSPRAAGAGQPLEEHWSVSQPQRRTRSQVNHTCPGLALRAGGRGRWAGTRCSAAGRMATGVGTLSPWLGAAGPSGVPLRTQRPLLPASFPPNTTQAPWPYGWAPAEVCPGNSICLSSSQSLEAPPGPVPPPPGPASTFCDPPHLAPFGPCPWVGRAPLDFFCKSQRGN